MFVKKANAYLALISILMLVLHAAYQLFSYIAFFYNPMLSAAFGFTLLAAVLLHVFLSVVSIFVLHDAKTILYKKLNIRTLIQRISALLMILLLPIHVNEFQLLQNISNGVEFVVLEGFLVMFYAALFLHVSASFTKALITLGWLYDDEKRKAYDRLLMRACALVFVIVAAISIHTHISLINNI